MTRRFSRRELHALLLFALAPAVDATENPRVLLQTSLGGVVIELFPARAPGTVANFLRYVDDGFYDGTIFHRVIAGFMAQGGGFTADYQRKPTGEAIANEADNGLSNSAGTIAMARTGHPHSATTQFFINLVDNDYLDHRDKSAGWGYCVFGRVVEGGEVLERIAAAPTGGAGPFARDVPLQTITINTVRRLSTP